MNQTPLLTAAALLLTATASLAQTPASVPYTPSPVVRHHLQLLSDLADLPLPISHWPLPQLAVEQALTQLPHTLPVVSGVDLEASRQAVRRELEQSQLGNLNLQLRGRAEGLTGFNENHTPGSSLHLSSAEKRWTGDGSVSLAGRLGAKLEQTSYSLASGVSGLGTNGAYQLRAEASAAVLGWAGWNVQAFSHRHWWGPGWQSSLVNGSNNPAWNGVGVQRGSAQPSSSPWLSWMGPWNLDVFVARAQDPAVIANQPRGYLFSGMRLTLKPQPWLEVGLSRGLQTGGAGRPSGVANFAKSFLGQEVNQNPGDPVDSSSQIAGYDVRVRCPRSWGMCAAYTQWMGEDAAGKVPLPFKFMSLWGVEHSYGQGRYRVFAEYTNTNAYSLPWDSKPSFAGYTNGVYTQGYTHGGRWIGSAQGGGSKVLTLGWVDALAQRMVKVHSGDVLWSVGAGTPGVQGPHGRLLGISASQTLAWRGWHWTPELSWMRLSEGADVGANRRQNVRLGVSLQKPF